MVFFHLSGRYLIDMRNVGFMQNRERLKAKPDLENNCTCNDRGISLKYTLNSHTILVYFIRT